MPRVGLARASVASTRLRRSLDRRCATGHFSPIGSAPWYWGSPRATRSGSRCSRACSSSSRCCRPSSSRVGGRTSPGEQGRKWFIIATLALFVAMLFAVNVFARRTRSLTPRRPVRRRLPRSRALLSQPRRRRPPRRRHPERPRGDPAAGKTLFTSQGCGGLSCVRGRGHERHGRPEPRRGVAGQGRGVRPRVDRRPERRGCPGFSAGGHAGRLRPEALGEADRGSGRFSLAELAKRRGRDSNPRPTFPQVRDFQSRSLGQLGHLSEVGHISSDFRRCQCGQGGGGGI